MSCRYEWLLVLFFFAHLLAVAVESIPREARDSISPVIQNIWSPLTRPYSVITGQYQRWNLFAPDPATKIVEVVEVIEDQEIFTMVSPEVLPWYRKAYVLKFARALVHHDEQYDEHRQQFLNRICEQFDREPGVVLRLQSRVSHIGSAQSTPQEDVATHQCPS